jgi:hypothetical protein
VNLLSQLLAGVYLSARDHDVGPLGREGSDHLAPKASASAGDQGDPTSEIKQLVHSPHMELLIYLIDLFDTVDDEATWGDSDLVYRDLHSENRELYSVWSRLHHLSAGTRVTARP